MYTAYFGLSEAPFTIAPDPAYLFLSDRHREALSHLTYGLGDNGGFVLLTGEVGTGKTTLSRTVMEKLPENTQLAFILNPTLSCEELLATICDNLKIRYKKTGATLKYLTDKIQDKLIANHEQGITTLVIIDEAQHLQAEVLEQLRLLTNLETNTQKLLQVILIGQPELQQLLQRRDLRQLAQRITARYHLMPLTKKELANYIQHRLSVAQCTRNLFNAGAISAIHKISKGIPRVVNLLCDRALVLAYSANQTVVNKKIVLAAAREALGEEIPSSFGQSVHPKMLILFSVFIVALLAGTWMLNQWQLNAINQRYSQLQTTAPEKQEPDLPAESKLINQPDTTNQPETTKQANTVLENTAENQASQSEIANAIGELALDRATNVTQDLDVEDETEKKPLILGFNAQEYQAQQEQENLQLTAEEGVSAELLERFKQAVVETEQSNDESPARYLVKEDVIALHKMPVDFQNALPALSFEMHMYQTEGKGWVRVNGVDHREGEPIANGVVLDVILPQKVILTFKEQQFSMPALSSW